MWGIRVIYKLAVTEPHCQGFGSSDIGISYISEHEDYCLMECDAVHSGR